MKYQNGFPAWFESMYEFILERFKLAKGLETLKGSYEACWEDGYEHGTMNARRELDEEKGS